LTTRIMNDAFHRIFIPASYEKNIIVMS